MRQSIQHTEQQQPGHVSKAGSLRPTVPGCSCALLLRCVVLLDVSAAACGAAPALLNAASSAAAGARRDSVWLPVPVLLPATSCFSLWCLMVVPVAGDGAGAGANRPEGSKDGWQSLQAATNVLLHQPHSKSWACGCKQHTRTALCCCESAALALPACPGLPGEGPELPAAFWERTVSRGSIT